MRNIKTIIALFSLFFILYSLALTYRYEPIAGSQNTIGTISVWDRWKNRVCIVAIGKGNRPMCSLEEMSR